MTDEGSARSGEVGDHRSQDQHCEQLGEKQYHKWECLRVLDAFLRDIDDD